MDNVQQEDAYALPEPGRVRGLSRTHRVWLLMASVVLLWFWGTLDSPRSRAASAYYLTVSSSLPRALTPTTKNLRVNGTLVPTSIERDSGGTLMHFSLTDGQDTINAVHDGVVPDLFSTSTRRSCWRAPTARRACSTQRPS